MKIQFRLFISMAMLIFLIACEHKIELKDIIKSEHNPTFNHTRTVIDAKNEYKIKLGKNWKTELYVDEYQSRMYAADTTRAYSKSFIIDISRFEGNITLTTYFKDHLLAQINSIPRAYVISEGFFDFNGSPAYCVYSFQKKDDIILYNIQCYISYKTHYFLLESKINGTNSLNQNISESLFVFNSLTPILKQ